MVYRTPKYGGGDLASTAILFLSNLRQGVGGGGRRGHVYCSFACGQELMLRAGSSSLIRRQLFAMVRTCRHQTAC